MSCGDNTGSDEDYVPIMGTTSVGEREVEGE